MKKLLMIFALLGLCSNVWAQSPAAVYTPDQLDELTAPIALYPDPLIAIILPASTAPSDIVLAARYLQANGDPAQVDQQPWDESVKALTNYPEVISWMNDNLDWTTALGVAFVQEPAQVMESIQQMRAVARANGSLVNTPEQNVVVDDGTIQVVPADNDYICVPQYDPAVVFVPDVFYTTPIIFFGPHRRVGPWLRFRCDWDDFGIWVGTYQPGWAYRREWRDPRPANSPSAFWRPDPVRQRAVIRASSRPVVAAPPRPHPMPGAPKPPAGVQPNSRPGPAPSSTRPDVRGWHTGPDGRLAQTPAAPVRPTAPVRPAAPAVGPTIITSTPANRPPPAAENPRERPAPESPIVNVPPSAPARTPSAPVVSPAPAPAAPRTVAPGPVFGNYDRGTEARSFSQQGQASRAAVAPPPAARPAPAPAPRAVEPAPQSRPAPGPSAPPAAAPSRGTFSR